MAVVTAVRWRDDGGVAGVMAVMTVVLLVMMTMVLLVMMTCAQYMDILAYATHQARIPLPHRLGLLPRILPFHATRLQRGHTLHGTRTMSSTPHIMCIMSSTPHIKRIMSHAHDASQQATNLSMRYRTGDRRPDGTSAEEEMSG